MAPLLNHDPSKVLATMTPEEKALMDLTGEIANKFHALPVQHPSDLPEFYTLIHGLQNIILGRVGYRAYMNMTSNGIREHFNDIANGRD